MPLGPAFKNRPAGGTGPALASDGTDRVFARVAGLLRGSTELHGSTIRAWDDPAEDLAGPGTDGPPWARLTPSPGMSRIYCRTAAGVVHKMPLEVAIATSTPGSDVIQSQRFWGAILRALFPGPTLDSQLQALGVSRLEVQRPGWGGPVVVKDAREGSTARCEGEGKIELWMYFTTPE